MSGQQNYTEDPAVMGFNNQQPIEEEEEEELTVLDSQHVCNLFIIFIQRKLLLSHGLISCNRPLCSRLLSSSAAAAMWPMLMIFDVSAAAGQEASGSSDRPAAKQTAENQPGAEWKGLLHSLHYCYKVFTVEKAFKWVFKWFVLFFNMPTCWSFVGVDYSHVVCH